MQRAHCSGPEPAGAAVMVRRAGQPVPAWLWQPPRARALVLAIHGGSAHKTAPAMRALATALARHQVATLSIDGPVHGDRAPHDPLDAQAAKQAFRDAWRAGIGHTDMARDASAALDVVLADTRYAGLPVGFAGVSMGAAYGIPLLAVERRIQAAAIGQWGLDYPNSKHLARFAPRIQCPVWFNQQLDDTFFSEDGMRSLFDAIGSPDKRLAAYPGPHGALAGPRLLDAVGFLVRILNRPGFCGVSNL